jgi:flagellar biosynthesis protein FliR
LAAWRFRPREGGAGDGFDRAAVSDAFSQDTAMTISQWPMMVFSELLIGVALGVATNIVFDGVQMAGQVLSVQMGYSLVNILDPQTQVESTVVATFHQTIAMLIFLRLNVHFWILRALARSFDYLPPASGHFGAAFTTAALQAGAECFAIGIQIAAPVLSATLLADIALGLLGQGISATAADAAGSGGKEHSGPADSDFRAQVLAESV